MVLLRVCTLFDHPYLSHPSHSTSSELACGKRAPPDSCTPSTAHFWAYAFTSPLQFDLSLASLIQLVPKILLISPDYRVLGRPLPPFPVCGTPIVIILLHLRLQFLIMFNIPNNYLKSCFLKPKNFRDAFNL